MSNQIIFEPLQAKVDVTNASERALIQQVINNDWLRLEAMNDPQYALTLLNDLYVFTPKQLAYTKGVVGLLAD